MTDKVTPSEIVEALRAYDKSMAECGYTLAVDKTIADRIEQYGIAPPDGWVLAPNEPTAVMVEAYSRASEQLKKNHLLSGSYPAIWQPIEAGYKAMRDAAPKDKP